jgi:ribosomal protein S18 acetylase RimI-like enzyme
MTEEPRAAGAGRAGGVEIRLAEKADAAAIGELTVRAYADGGLVSEGDAYATQLADAWSRLDGAELWVATVAGTMRGSVTFCPPGSVYREIAGPGEGEFRMLAVDPAARRQGVGKALTQRCLDRCAELGLRHLVLCSLADNGAAQSLYRSMGFIRDTTLDWEPAPGVRLIGFRAVVSSARSGSCVREGPDRLRE